MAQYNTALSIILDQELHTVYSPGSIISGRVQLQTPKAQPIFRLYVDFAGRCKASIVRNQGDHGDRYYDSKGYFFYDRTVLFNAAQDFGAGSYTWPFQFTVPAYATPGMIQSPNGKGDDYDATPPWRGTTTTPNDHPLPASFSSHRADVEYYIKTTLLPDGGQHIFNKDLTYTVPIRFSPLRAHDPSLLSVQVKSERDFRIQTLKLLPEDSEDRHSFRKRFKGVFHSDSLPEVALHTVLVFPRYLDAVPGSRVPCSLLVTCVSSAFGEGQPDEKSTLAPKTITLHRLELRLRAETERRAGRHTDTDQEKFYLADFDGAREIPVHHAWSGQSPPDPTDLGEMFNLHVQNHIVPDFSTYNIAQHYTLDLKLKLVCAGEDVRYDLDYQPIEIVPPPAQGMESTYQYQPGAQPFEQALPQDEYQDQYQPDAYDPTYKQEAFSYDQPPPAYGQYT